MKKFFITSGLLILIVWLTGCTGYEDDYRYNDIFESGSRNPDMDDLHLEDNPEMNSGDGWNDARNDSRNTQTTLSSDEWNTLSPTN